MNTWKIIGWIVLAAIALPMIAGLTETTSSSHNAQATGLQQTQYKPSARLKLKVSNLTCAMTPGGMIKIEARITNTGNQTLDLVQGHASFYNDGRLIDNGIGYADMLPIGVGQSSQITILGPTRNAAEQCEIEGFTGHHNQRIEFALI